MLNFDNSMREKRRQLIDNLRRRGIKDERVLKAMDALPREKFLSSSFLNRAYEDTALPIDCHQTISQPYTVAYMTELLEVGENDKILEIGTGSGYQACLLYLMGARVFTVERIKELFEISGMMFKEFGMNINIRLGDGSLGWSQYAPFDGIIVTAAAPVLPKNLISQLAEGGRLVVPVGDRYTQIMYCVKKTGKSSYEEIKTDRFQFVPLIGKEGWEE